MYKLAFACISFISLIAAPAYAAGGVDAKWTVTQLSGDARIVHPGLQPASAHVRSELVPGDTLVTGPSGRATLVRGADYIVVAPQSEMQVPSAPQPTGFTRVIQNLGTLLFKVQHTGIPHFAVDTPMLAAVVKGTTFTVVVDHGRSAVQVIQGVVQVSAIDGGMSRMVEGGRTIFVDHRTPKVLLDADKPLPATSQPSSTSTTVTVSAAGETPLASISELTGGLVRAETAALVASPVAAVVQATPAPAPTATSDAPSATTPVITATATPGTTPTATAAPTTVTTSAPSITTPAVTVATVSVPSLTISTSGPGSPNSGPGSVNSGPGSTTIVSVAPITTPAVTTPIATVPSVSTPTVSVATAPTVTVPAVTTPTVTVPSVTIPVLAVTTPTITVPTVSTPTVTVTLPPLLKL